MSRYEARAGLTPVGYFWGLYDTGPEPALLVEAFVGEEAEERAKLAARARNE